MEERQIAILGSTGSIGRQALQVCQSLGLRVAALTAQTNASLLEEQARAFLPALAVLGDEAAAKELRLALADTPVRVEGGAAALERAATLPQADTVLGAIVGIAGLPPVLAAARAGKTIALANKEALVCGGALVTAAARAHGASILPVDSEHSAIFQCLAAGDRRDVEKVLLTASGGPFYGRTAGELAAVTPRQALRHPNWSMGAKITVDSATLMNKGLELMEALWLFDLRPDQVEIVIQRESVIHSGVFFADGSLIAQMGPPDMRAAIQYALTWPRRQVVEGVPPLDLAALGQLTFGTPDRETFLCLAACEEAAARGGLYPALVNGANEAAVELFLAGELPFLQIGALALEALELTPPKEMSLAAVEEADALGREFVRRKSPFAAPASF